MLGAVFLDRDGTIIHDPGYLDDAGRVALLPNAAEGLGAMTRAGWPLVIVSNQSGIARGLYGPDSFATINRRIEELLAPERVRFLAAYFCPHLPEISGACRCRKPGVELFERAAGEHNLDLARSWFVGDRARDVEPALTLGGRGLLVAHEDRAEDVQRAAGLGVARVADLLAAASLIGALGP